MTPPSRAVRHRSRRRLAALAFLSNISLDGTYRDTKISGLNARRATATAVCADSTDAVDAATATAAAAGAAAEAVPPSAAAVGTADVPAPVSVAETALAVGAGAGAARPAPVLGRLRRQKSVDSSCNGETARSGEATSTHRERCQTVGGDSDGILKRLVQQANIGSLLDDMRGGHASSSCESVCGSVRSHKLCGSVSEVSGPGVRFVRSVRERCSLGDERLVLVGRARLPLLVLSLLPLGRVSRPGRRERHDRGDHGSRRRYNSGSRPPLTTIADRVDAFCLLGLEPLLEGQEVSYSRLLQPSQVSLRAPRRLHSVENELDAAAAVHQRNAAQHTLNRCISHDPSSGGRPAGTANWPPGDRSTDRVVEEEPAAEPQGIPYDPLLLDNPETQSENHRTVLTFRSYRSSIIDYMKPSELKRVTNEQFREQFPHIQLTLSKLRSLKRDLRRIATECHIDSLSVAQAHVYFEKLVLRGLIDKPSRKLVAGACLLLAAKMNDVKGETMSQLVERTEAVYRINRRDLITCEFSVLVALEFALHLQTSEIEPHLRRLEA